MMREQPPLPHKESLLLCIKWKCTAALENRQHRQPCKIGGGGGGGGGVVLKGVLWVWIYLIKFSLLLSSNADKRRVLNE